MESSKGNKYEMKVVVQPQYIPDQSDEDQGRYVFAYQVTVINVGSIAARLQNRHWIIDEGTTPQQEVRGEGVVGEKPHLEPGEGFQYVSGVVLASPVGTMRGSYEFVADDGCVFDAEVEPFVLSVPRTLH